MSSSIDSRQKRKLSIRKRIDGTPDRPRLSVFRSAKHIYVQVVDDVNAVTLAASSSILNEMRLQFKSVKKSEQANAVGRQIASVCLKSGIQKVVFDRNGFRYHGRISALADGAREGGLIF